MTLSYQACFIPERQLQTRRTSRRKGRHEGESMASVRVAHPVWVKVEGVEWQGRDFPVLEVPSLGSVRASRINDKSEYDRLRFKNEENYNSV